MADPMRPVASKLQAARDEQVARIVALVDGMATRGAADALIAPLRPRLQQLRPARLPRFGRILFTPLDPVIVPTATWRGDPGTVPRGALEPIEGLVRAGLGAAMAPIEAAIARLRAAEPTSIGRIGASLWGPASVVLREARAPAAWVAAGLPEAAFDPTRRAVVAVLAAATEIDGWKRHDQDEPAPTAPALRAMLASALSLGAGACGVLGAVLLARIPHRGADILAAIAAFNQRDNAAARTAAEVALDTALGHLETTTAAEIGAGSLTEAARAAEAAASLLKGLARDANQRRRERLAADRAGLDETCRARFADALTTGLMEPMQALDEEATPAQAADFETAARDLRRFEQAARQLGSPAAYDAALRAAAEQVHALPVATGQTLADRVRLVEILAGAEQALLLLDGGQIG